MRAPTRSIVTLAAATALTCGAVAVTSTGAVAGGDKRDRDQKALGLSSTGTSLTVISLRSGRTGGSASVKGLEGDTKLIGIDQRPADRKFYGVGDRGGVYTIDTRNGSVTKVSQLTVALDGTDFGVDFNPVADRLRVISDTGQNLRHDVAGSVTTTDGPLAYTPGTPATGLTAAAYTNNDNDAATGTTLFDIDTAKDQVAQQVPANAGTLVLSGPLGTDASSVAGYDIVSKVRDGKAVANTGYAVLRAPGSSKASLYLVDPLSGSASKIARVSGDVADLAIPQG